MPGTEHRLCVLLGQPHLTDKTAEGQGRGRQVGASKSPHLPTASLSRYLFPVENGCHRSEQQRLALNGDVAMSEPQELLVLPEAQ